MLPVYFRAKYQNEPMDIQAINNAWRSARKLGIINPPTHKTAPLEISDWQRLVNLIGAKLTVMYHTAPDGSLTTHWPIDTVIPAGCWGFYAWYNPRTNFTHFVVGKSRPVEYDPIAGGSITVKEGYPKAGGLRLFHAMI